MGLIGWLILSFGAFAVASGSKCIPETAVCSRYWTKLEPHKNLMESEDELNSWCRKQALFYGCLGDVLLGRYGNYTEVPTNLLISKMFSDDLCLGGSISRKRYLSNAACINQLNTEYCTLPEYLNIVTIDDSIPPSRCSISEKTFSCIAATLVMNCGFDAGRVYRYLLKVTKVGNEICDVESSAGVQCNESNDSDKKDQLSEIYYGLVHRIGSIPEEVPESNLSVLNEMPNSSYIQGDESVISEAIGSALDAIDSTEGNINADESENMEFHETVILRSQDASRKTPIITEPFKGLLFYNYSGEDFAFYWRQPGTFPVKRVTCEHMINRTMKGVILQCLIYHEFHDHCVRSEKGEDERITPELIRDIDFTIPEDSTTELSPKPDWVGRINDYKRERMSWEFFFNVWIVIGINSIRQVNRYLAKEYPANPFTCANEIRLYDVINNFEVEWWRCPSLFSEELRTEILSTLFPNKTSDDFLIMSTFNGNDTTHFHLFEPILHGFDDIVCERVNECHPRGRGVFKCSMKRRHIKGCDTCCILYPVYATPRYKLPQSKNEESDAQSLSGEMDSAVEASGSSSDMSSEESIALMLDNVTPNPTGEQISFITEATEENGEHISVISKLTGMPHTEPSTDASILFLEQDAEEPEKESLASDIMYGDGITNALQNKANYQQLSEDEYALLDENMFVLQAMPSDEAEAIYEIVHSPEDNETP